jgi:plasmid segregation protein ParM
VRDVRVWQVDCASFPSMAPVAPDCGVGEALGMKRNTIIIEVEAVSYELGPDVELVQRAVAVRNMDDDYVMSPGYRSLLRGAVTHTKKDAIDILVVGLPVSNMTLLRAELERLVSGEHQIVKDAEFSNLRGFQIAGAEWAVHRARECAAAA